MSLKAYWDKLPASYQYEIKSIVHTFIASAVMYWVATGAGIPTTRDALFGLLVAMFRAGVKAVSVMVFPPSESQTSQPQSQA